MGYWKWMVKRLREVKNSIKSIGIKEIVKTRIFTPTFEATIGLFSVIVFSVFSVVYFVYYQFFVSFWSFLTAIIGFFLFTHGYYRDKKKNVIWRMDNE